MTNPPDPEDGQTRLIGCDDPLILATGGPGSGKTQAALLLAVRLLESEPAGSTRSVLFLTFSRAATRELLERSPRLVPKALRHRLEITTFHGYSRTILESFGRFNGRGTDPLTIASRTEVKLKLSPPGSLALDDLIPEAVKLLKASPLLCDRLSRRLVAVISDEYQDTGDAQDQMLELLSSQSRLLCLADPDQMIYDFIADVSPRRLTLLRAKNPTEIPLEQRSHRDPSGLIPRVARAIHDRQFADPALAEALRCGRLRVRTDTNPLFAGVVEEVRALRIAGHRSVGVFVSQRFMVEELGRELGAAKIEHEIAGLDDAAGEAETVISSLAMYATGQATWDDVCQRMAVFLTSSQPKHGVPDVAWMLMGSRQYLPGGLPTRLLALQDALMTSCGCSAGANGSGGLAAEIWPGRLRPSSVSR
jgi:DNA helicase-2/ATP-dependent DNA helicase PcrA